MDRKVVRDLPFLLFELNAAQCVRIAARLIQQQIKTNGLVFG